MDECSYEPGMTLIVRTEQGLELGELLWVSPRSGRLQIGCFADQYVMEVSESQVMGVA